MTSGAAEMLEELVHFADGTAAIWWSTKAPMRDADGEVIGLIGSSVDITDRKRAEEALRLSEQRAAIAMEVAQLGTWDLDVAGGTVTADARCRWKQRVQRAACPTSHADPSASSCSARCGCAGGRPRAP